MSYTTHTALEQIDYGFLLLVHLICADKQIHSEEIKYLNELSDRANISQQTKDEMGKILAQNNQHLTLDLIRKQIKIEQRSPVMEQILTTFYDEGLFGLTEENAIAHIASICSWSQKGIKRIIKAKGYKAASNYKISLAASQHSEIGIDYGFLLLVHLICADKQIHSEEIKYLNELSDRANISQQTKDEMGKILAQNNQHLTLDCIAKQVTVGERSEVMRQILAIAYADGYFAPSEKEMVDRLASLWNWSSKEVDRIIAGVENKGDRTHNNSTRDKTELSFAAKLFRHEQKSALSRAVIDMASRVAPETIGKEVERLERRILLSGHEYDEAIALSNTSMKELIVIRQQFEVVLKMINPKLH